MKKEVPRDGASLIDFMVKRWREGLRPPEFQTECRLWAEKIWPGTVTMKEFDAAADSAWAALDLPQ